MLLNIYLRVEIDFEALNMYTSTYICNCLCNGLDLQDINRVFLATDTFKTDESLFKLALFISFTSMANYSLYFIFQIVSLDR